MDYSNDPMARLFVDLTKKVGDALIGLTEVFDGQPTGVVVCAIAAAAGRCCFDGNDGPLNPKQLEMAVQMFVSGAVDQPGRMARVVTKVKQSKVGDKNPSGQN